MEGYLIKLDDEVFANIYYFVLGEGFLEYFTKKNGESVGKFKLTKQNLTIQHFSTDYHIGNCFKLTAREIFEVDKKFILDTVTCSITLCTTNRVNRNKWMHGIQYWRRHCFDTEIEVVDCEKEDLSSMIKKFGLYNGSLPITEPIDYQNIPSKTDNKSTFCKWWTVNYKGYRRAV